MSNTIETIMSLVDQVTPGLEKIREQLKQTEKSADETGEALDGAGGAGANTGNKFGDMIPKMKGLAIGIGAVVTAAMAAAAALNAMGRAGIAFGDEIGDMAGKVGVTAGELQRLRLTAEMNGGSFEAVDKSLLKLNQTLGQAQRGTGPLVQVMDELGISTKNVDGSFKSANQVFNELGIAIGSLDSEAKKTAYSMEAFGDSGQQLVEMFNMSTDEVRKADDMIRQYGGYLSEGMVEAASEAKNEIAGIEQGTATLTNQLNIAVGLPVAVWWTKIANATAKASVELAKFLGLMNEFDGSFDNAFQGQSTSSLEQELDARLKDIDAYKKRLNEIKDEWDNPILNGIFAYPIRRAVDGMLPNGSRFESEASQLERRIAQYEEATAAMERVLKQRKTPEAPDETSAVGLDYLEKYRIEVQKAEAQALSNKKAQAQAMLQVELDRLDTEHKEALRTNQLSTADQLALEQLLAERKAALRQQTANQIAEIDKTAAAKSKAEIEKLAADQRKADQEWLDAAIKREESARKQSDYIDGIVTKLAAQSAQNDAIVNGTEKQLQLRTALNEAEEQAIKNGTTLSDIDRARISNAILANQQSADRLKEFNDMEAAAKRNADAIDSIYRNAAESIQASFSDFFFDVMQGDLSDLATSFKRTIDRMVADLLASKLLAAIGGVGNGTAAGGGISGAFAGMFGGIAGRAVGGPVTAGTPYWVGEEGPEIVVPKNNATVIPADLSQAVAGAGTQASSNAYHVTIQALDSKSFLDMIERDDRSIVNALSKATHRYGVR